MSENLFHPVHTKNGDGWVVCRLGELCDEDRRLAPSSLSDGSVLPCLGLEHVEAETGRIVLNGKRPDEDVGDFVTAFAFDRRHVLYGKLRPYLNKVAVPDFTGRCSTELIPLLPKDWVSRRFLAHMLRRPQTVAAAMEEKTGARMPRASMRHVFATRVRIPQNRAVQEEMADQLDRQLCEIDRIRGLCRKQLSLLDQLQKRLLSDFSNLER